MVDPVRMFADGGPFMLLLAALAVMHALLCVVQLVMVRRLDLVPGLWAGVVSLLLTGMLGTMMGQIMMYNAVAVASAEMKTVLMAQGTAVSLYTTAGALLFALPAVLMTGGVHSVVRTTRMHRRDDPTGT